MFIKKKKTAILHSSQENCEMFIKKKTAVLHSIQELSTWE